MWWAINFAFTISLASFATCTPIEPASHQIARDGAAGRHRIIGVGTRDNGGHPHLRREVRDLAANYPDHWALYLLGLLQFQQVDQNDPLSYYRISGIHARPFEIWQDAQGTPGAAVGGYCPHSSPLFLSWHRPYLALFEQELWKHVRSIADRAQQDHARWSAAANEFRIPYWDTALGNKSGRVPPFLTSPRWSVAGPEGTQLIDNPLFWYQFHPLVPGDFAPGDIRNYNQTMRYPTSHNSDAKPQMKKLEQGYLKHQRNRQDGVNIAFSKDTSFNEFAVLLENAHSDVHTSGGGTEDSDTGVLLHGHMWWIDNSAFDPMFMLHHANFDRLMALYQAAHPDIWLQPETTKNTNFWIPYNTVINATYPLVPFWKNEQACYTSEDIRHPDVLGYAYPETQYWKFASTEQWRNDVKASIQRLYPHSAQVMLTNAVASGSDLTNVLEKGNMFTQWTIEVSASVTEMPPTFRAIFSLTGDFSSDRSAEVGIWSRLLAEVGETGTWKARQAERKAKRYSMSGQSISGSVSLTSSLLDQIAAGKLESLDAAVVVSYLKAHLTWNVYAGNEMTHMSGNQLDSFVVEVTGTKVRNPADLSQPLEYTSDKTSYRMGEVDG